MSRRGQLLNAAWGLDRRKLRRLRCDRRDLAGCLCFPSPTAAAPAAPAMPAAPAGLAQLSSRRRLRRRLSGGRRGGRLIARRWNQFQLTFVGGCWLHPLCRLACALAFDRSCCCGRRRLGPRGNWRSQPRQRLFSSCAPLRSPEALRGRRVPLHRFGRRAGLLVHFGQFKRHHAVARAFKELAELRRGLRRCFRLADACLDLSPVCHVRAL